MVDALHRLGHDAVIGGDHQDGNIRHHGAAGTHGGKGLVARGVEEGDGAAVDLDGIGADVLGDAARLAGDDVGMANIVEQRGFAVVDVAHDDDDRGAGLEVLILIRGGVDEALFHGDDDFLLDLAAELHRDQGRGVIVDDIRDGGENAHLDKLLDDLGSRLLHARGQLADGDLVGNLDLQRLLFGDLALQAVHLVPLFLTALAGGLLLGLLALFGLGVDLLLVAAAALTAAKLVGVGTAAGHVLKLLIVFLNVDRRTAARIDHALLRDLARNVRLLLLLLFHRAGLALCGSGLRLCCLFLGGSLGRLILAVLVRGGRGLLFGLRLFGGRFGLLLHRRCHLEDILQTLDLVVLGHVFEDDIQLRVLENLHMILRRRHVIGQDLRDHLGGGTKILRDLMNPVFQHSHTISPIKTLLINYPSIYLKTFWRSRGRRRRTWRRR